MTADAEQPAAERVVDPADERLLVLALLGAGDDVGPALEDGRHQPGDVLGEVLQVGGVEHEDVAAGDVAGGAERVGDAPLPPVGDDAEERMRRARARASTPRALVARAVVHDHDFER